MGKVLVLHDRPSQREPVVEILAEAGHQPLEAADGGEALTLMKRERPEVVISDILMPTMDSHRFANEVRSDPAISRAEIILYTAHFRAHAARNIADDCGISYVLVRPSEPEQILAAVEDSIRAATRGASPLPPEASREHVRLLVEKLALKNEALRISTARLAASYELNLEFASEIDPRELLRTFCRGAREATGARYAVVGMRPRGDDERPILMALGLDEAMRKALALGSVDAGDLGRALADRRSRRFSGRQADPIAMGLPYGFPKIDFAISAPIASPSTLYGWICLADKLGEPEFNVEDELFLGKTASQVGRIYELRCSAESTLVELTASRSKHDRRNERAREATSLAKQLNQNEREIVRLVAGGSSTIEAAEELGLSPRTVETYRARLMEKVEVDTFADLVKFAIRSGLTKLD